MFACLLIIKGEEIVANIIDNIIKEKMIPCIKVSQHNRSFFLLIWSFSFKKMNIHMIFVFINPNLKKLIYKYLYYSLMNKLF